MKWLFVYPWGYAFPLWLIACGITLLGYHNIFAWISGVLTGIAATMVVTHAYQNRESDGSPKG